MSVVPWLFGSRVGADRHRAPHGASFAALLLALVGHCVPLRAQAPDPAKKITQYRLETWTDQAGLPGNSAQSLAQSADGYLWVGSEAGLARFDGVRFTVYDPTNTPALRASYIRALLPASDGSVWLGVEGGGIARMHKGKLTRFDKRQGLSSDQIATLAPATDGGLWIGTSGGGLDHLAIDSAGQPRVRVFSRPQGLPHDFVNAVVEALDSTVWIGTPLGLSRLRHGHVTPLGAAEGNPAQGVTSLLRTRSGDVLVGTTTGLSVLRDGRVRPYDAPGIAGVHVRALLEDSRGTLWVGTHGSGLLRVADHHVSRLTTKEGLGADLVRALYEDREGGIWIATNGGGLQRLHDSPLTVFGAPEGLPVDIALAVLQDRDGAMWLGTAGGGLARLEHGDFTLLGTAQGLSHNVVVSLAQDRDGVVWAGTANGLSRLANGRVTSFGVRDGIAANAVLATFVDSRGALWLGTDGGGLQRWRPGAPVTYRKANGLPNDVVTTIAEDARGDLWVGTREGVARLRGGEFETFRSACDTHDVLALHVDTTGALWIGTGNGGLSRLKDGQLRCVTTAHGLPENAVYAIVEDGLGGLWLTGPKGIVRLAKHEVERAMERGPWVGRLHVRRLGVDDGMRTREANGGVFPSAWRARDGRIWVPTLRGVVVLDPARLAARAPAPPVRIESVVAREQLFAAGEAVHISAGARTIGFNFTALTFDSPREVRFRYRLEGFDTTWVEGGTARVARYTNIPPGSYVFRVSAAHGDGPWSDQGAAIPLELEAHFYETASFRALVALLATALAIGIAAALHRRRVRQLQARERELVALVTDRTRAEERYRELFENATDAVFTTDLQGRLTSVNRRFVELTGYERDDLLGRGIGTLLYEEGGEPGELPAAWRTPTVATEMEIVRRDGVHISHEISTRHVTTGDRPTGMQAIARDVTERRRLEQRLLQAQRMEALGQLAGGVAHDFNNILVAIMGYSELLLEELMPENPHHADVTEIGNAARRAATLTRQLLAFSRQQVLQPRVLSLNEVVMELQSMLRRLLREDVDMRIMLAPSVGLVAADPGQLEQVLLNLVVNARDAMPSGGTITIETSATVLHQGTTPDVGGVALAPGRYTVLEVRDNGTGMTPEVRARIFEPFYTTKAQGKGTGLGLATVHGIVEQSGGYVTCESQPGRGTTFRIFLPEIEGAAYRAAGPAVALPARGSETVLVVEDDAVVRGATRRILETRGYEVLEARNGVEALMQCADNDAIDLVVTDMIMPEMNGYELTLLLRARRPGLPVVLMSGYAGDTVTGDEMLHAAAAFVEKPFTPESLAAKVRDVLDLKGRVLR
jgi:PAS domain S-box-containing protein